MPRPRIEKFWIDHIRVMVAEHVDWSGAEIRRELAKLKDAPGPVPSDRAIRRAKEEFGELPPEKQDPYKRFQWPESMELKSNALPWEASRACLDLLRRYHDAGLPAPLIQECLWFWRVSLAVPELPLDQRILIAASMVAVDASGRQPDNMRSLETALAFQRSPDSLSFAPGPGVYHMTTLFNLSQKKGQSDGRQRPTKKR